MQATERTSTLDLAISKNLTLSPKIPYYKIPTGEQEPLSPKIEEMVLGGSSLTPQGFIVHPGITDEDFKGDTEIRAYINKNTHLKEEDRIA